jgi:pimeloyl-ACP methyl ester carboxylesterase
MNIPSRMAFPLAHPRCGVWLRASMAAMTEIRHRFVETNGIRMHVAESGPDDGPAVLLCHGFPECWYSWRHQLRALGEAGYHVLAPDQRGYGETDMPLDIGEYTQLHLVGDLVGLLRARGIARAAIVGHDWGAPVAWHAALLRPDIFDSVAALSVHWSGVSPVATPAVLPTIAMRTALGGGFLYILHFQEPGVAEAELDADVRGSLGSFLFSLSGDIPRDRYRFFDLSAHDLAGVLTPLPGPLPWLSDADLDAFAASYAHHGTFFGGINWYRNIDRNAALLAPFVGRQIEQPALFIGAEHDSIFGQTHESVLATRSAVPNLREPIWVAGSGHWIQQEKPAEVNAALLDFLRSR